MRHFFLKRPLLFISILLTVMVYVVVNFYYIEQVKAYKSSHPSNVKLNMEVVQLVGCITEVNEKSNRYIFVPEPNQSIKTPIEIRTKEDGFLDAIISSGFCINISIDTNQIQFRAAHNAGSFDYDYYLYAKNVIGQYNVISFEPLINKEKSCLSYNIKLRANFMTLKYKLISKIDFYYDEEVSHYIKALIFGEKSELDIATRFKLLGISHILAISGFHFALLYKMLNGTIKGHYHFKSTIMVVILGFYMILLGQIYSAQRAFFLIFYLQSAKCLHRKPDVLTAFGFTNLILLIFQPFAVISVSYQLSFSAYLLIAYFYKNMVKVNSSKYLEMIKFTLIVQLMMFPIQSFYFNEMNLWGFLSNLIVVPLISTIMPLFVLASLFPYWFSWTNGLMKLYIVITEEIVNRLPLNQFKGQLLHKTTFLILLIFIACLLLIKCIDIEFRSDRRIKTAIGIFFLSLMMISEIVIISNRDLKIHFYDVGHGDSALIHYKELDILIDTGDGFNRISDLLLRNDVRELDYIILSHAHSDHIGGLLDLMLEIKVERLVLNEETLTKVKTVIDESDFEGELIILNQAVEYQDMSLIKDENFKMTVTNFKSGQETNDNALIVCVELGELKGVFLGDLGGAHLNQILGLNEQMTFVKVAHHGSSTGYSEQFYSEHQFEYAIISHSNKYLMPSSKMIELMNQEQIKVLSTYTNGEIEIKYNPKSRSVHVNSRYR